MVNYKSKYLEMKLKYINAKNKLIGGMKSSEKLLELINNAETKVSDMLKIIETKEFQPEEQLVKPKLIRNTTDEYTETYERMKADEVFKNQDLAKLIGTHRVKLVLQLFNKFVLLPNESELLPFKLYLKKKLNVNETLFLSSLINNNSDIEKKKIEYYNNPLDSNDYDELLRWTFEDYNYYFKEYEDIFINKKELTKYLLSLGANINYVDQLYWVESWIYAIDDDIEFLKFVLSNGASFNINYIAEIDYPIAINPLIEAINIKDSEKFTMVYNSSITTRINSVIDKIYLRAIFEGIKESTPIELDDILDILLKYIKIKHSEMNFEEFVNLTERYIDDDDLYNIIFSYEGIRDFFNLDRDTD